MAVSESPASRALADRDPVFQLSSRAPCPIEIDGPRKEVPHQVSKGVLEGEGDVGEPLPFEVLFPLGGLFDREAAVYRVGFELFGDFFNGGIYLLTLDNVLNAGDGGNNDSRPP